MWVYTMEYTMEPTRPHDPRIVRVIQRILIERARSVRIHPTTMDVRLDCSQELFYELFRDHRMAWLSFLRQWCQHIGHPFRVEYSPIDASSEWWISRGNENETIPWYNEADFVDDLFAVLDANMDWMRTTEDDDVEDSQVEMAWDVAHA